MAQTVSTTRRRSYNGLPSTRNTSAPEVPPEVTKATMRRCPPASGNPVVAWSPNMGSCPPASHGHPIRSSSQPPRNEIRNGSDLRYTDAPEVTELLLQLGGFLLEVLPVRVFLPDESLHILAIPLRGVRIGLDAVLVLRFPSR